MQRQNNNSLKPKSLYDWDHQLTLRATPSWKIDESSLAKPPRCRLHPKQNYSNTAQMYSPWCKYIHDANTTSSFQSTNKLLISFPSTPCNIPSWTKSQFQFKLQIIHTIVQPYIQYWIIGFCTGPKNIHNVLDHILFSLASAMYSSILLW